jgi:hypothetical protein
LSIEDYIDLFLDVIVPADEYELYPKALLLEHQALLTDQEAYLWLWGLLDSKKRSAWKNYLRMYREAG